MAKEFDIKQVKEICLPVLPIQCIEKGQRNKLQFPGDILQLLKKATSIAIRVDGNYDKYTQETGKLKATATTDTFSMIGQVILSIDDQHISPCKSLLVHPVSTKSI